MMCCKISVGKDNDDDDDVITLPLLYGSAATKYTGLWNKAAETVDDVMAPKLLVPHTARWFLAPICEIPMVELNYICSKFRLTAMTERGHQFIRVLHCHERHYLGVRQPSPWHAPAYAGDADVQDRRS